jgi:hypothetical protein
VAGLVSSQEEGLLDPFDEFGLSFPHSADGSDGFWLILHGFQQ